MKTAVECFKVKSGLVICSDPCYEEPELQVPAMNMESFKNPDSKYVKRYFKTKRYRVRSGKSLLKTTTA